ncbi:ComEC/Rec2 family competence protein [Derxia lacustris]|uniref:ComEC/Rec2 family competence protein n=1 Tax=Derxia lacustris TaxID=764842 RepID=UPI000A16D198|nr:ComEC/Rec2 family competence protein [Derxia lacustris]
MTVALALAFAAGVALLQMRPTLGPGWLGPASAAFALALLLLALQPGWRSGRCRSALLALAIAAAFALGHGWADWRAERRIARGLAPELEQRDLDIVGAVAGLPAAAQSIGADGLRFEFVIDHGTLDGRPVTLPQRVSLAWYGSERRADPVTVPALTPGERWQLRVRLRRPHARLNPDGPDLDYWMLEQDLRAVGSVRNAAGANRRLPGRSADPGLAVDRVRQAVNAHIARTLGSAEYAGVIAALVTGDQRAIGGE